MHIFLRTRNWTIRGQWSCEKIVILSLKPRGHVRILIHRKWAIIMSWTILKGLFFIQPRLASSRQRERRRRDGRSRSERMRPTAEPETGFEKVYIEPSVQSWLMQKRFLTCLCSTNGSYIFDIFTSALVIF